MKKRQAPVEPIGVSRRNFLKGAGGLVGASAIAPVLLGPRATEAADAPATREGIELLPAKGQELALNVNGQERRLLVRPDMTLLDALREGLGLTGSKEVCDRGSCGACTVLLDGRAVNSCLMLAADAQGHEIVTVEGLVQNGKLDPVQQAFVEHDACQCGYCIPGFVVSARSLLNQNPQPSLEEVKDGLAGNICRCAAYVRIFEAVEAAGKGGAA